VREKRETQLKKRRERKHNSKRRERKLNHKKNDNILHDCTSPSKTEVMLTLSLVRRVFKERMR
jgi:hypothetical protein